ncbi:TIGR04211 family SH3 domain-containing protein [Otariodibacter sp.]|uniref:TIGR04211 family SH3 domain-containing protein n=1 Tax=Otariodibacter sp. TaxID=3030919 RepID=UPI002615B916|nr:TIGR04211 family SH3 domain-containing protein [Otariodibacter sp.]
MQKVFSILLGCLIYIISLPSIAETLYVTDNLHTYLRKGAGDQYKISGTIQAGEQVLVLEKKERYSLIRDEKNREAWILNSELSTTPSSKKLVPQLQQQVEELTVKLNKIDGDWQQRTSEMQRRVKQADQQSSELLDQNARLKRELDILKNKNRELETMQDAEAREIMIQYFIYGGSVLGVGLLLGLLIPVIIPRRRRNSEWI